MKGTTYTRLIALFAAFLASVSLSANATVLHFVVNLSGAQEVDASGNPNQGDPDGSAIANVFVDTVGLTIDWNIVAENIQLPPIGAHIHQAPAGTNGSIVIDFSGQLSGTGLADPDIANLIANPSGFYVNVHNGDFPGGAIRGQIGSPDAVPEPTVLALLGIGLLAFWIAQRQRA